MQEDDETSADSLSDDARDQRVPQPALPLDVLGHLTSIALGHLQVWHRAVSAQAGRILDPDASSFDKQTDAYMFVQALRQVLRAAEMVQLGLENDPRAVRARAAIEEFNDSIPDAKNARDVLDHFDDYARGVGDLSHPGVRRPNREPTAEAAAQYTVFYEHGGPGRYTLHIGHLEIDVALARDSAERLAVSLYELVYQPADEEQVADILSQHSLDGPWPVAATFLMILADPAYTHEQRELLSNLVTPESLKHWGDFSEARRELRDHSITSRVIFDGDDVAYVRSPRSVGYVSVVNESTLIESYVVTLQRRPDVGGWRVHGIGGEPIPPEQLPSVYH